MPDTDLAELKLALKKMLISECDRDDLAPEDIADDIQLIGEGIGLDSLDALQIATAVKSEYGLRIEGNTSTRKHLASVGKLAEAITKHQQKNA